VPSEVFDVALEYSLESVAAQVTGAVVLVLRVASAFARTRWS
jgi:hypothetical protein